MAIFKAQHANNRLLFCAKQKNTKRCPHAQQKTKSTKVKAEKLSKNSPFIFFEKVTQLIKREKNIEAE